MSPTNACRRGGIAIADVVVALALAGGALLIVLVATRVGPAIGHDSATYLSAAGNFLSGGRYADFTLQPLTAFPPAYSILLAGGEWLGISGVDAGRYVNAGSMASTVLLSWFLARRLTSSRIAALLLAALVACSIDLLHIAESVRSEAAFIPLVLLCLLSLDFALRVDGQHAKVWCLTAGAVAGTAFLVRYAAIALLIAGVLAILACTRRMGWRVAIGRALLFAGAGALLPALWVARNASAHTDDVLGPRISNPQSLATLLRTTARAVGAVFVPEQAAEAAAVVLAVVGGIGLWYMLRRRHLAAWTDRQLLVVLSTFVGVYLIFVMASQRLAGSALDGRIASPIYVPLLLLGLACIEQYFGDTRVADAFVARHKVAVGSVAALLFCAFAVAATLLSSMAVPPGELIGARLGDSLAQSVKELPKGALVASNSPHFLWYASAHQPIVRSPGVAVPGGNPRPISVAELQHRACSHASAYLAWFSRGERDVLDSPEKLADVLALKSVARTKDGVLYRVQPVADC